MKKKTPSIKLGMFKYLLFVPVFLLTFCESDLEDPLLDSGSKLTKDAKVLSLMKSAIKSDSDESGIVNKESLFKSTASVQSETVVQDDQCTYFKYPMTFDVYSGDNPNPVVWEINSDEELISFIDTLVASTTTYEFYIYFPITLLDTDGVETVIDDLEALEGTLQMAVEACESLNADSSGGTDGSSGGTDGSSGGGEVSLESSVDSSGGTDGSSGGTDGSSGGTDGSSGGTDGSSGGTDGSSGGTDGSSGGTDGSSGGNDDGESQYVGSDYDEYDSEGDDHEEYEYCGKNDKKVIICHKGITICVSVNAIWGHMEHHEEDYLGTCVD